MLEMKVEENKRTISLMLGTAFKLRIDKSSLPSSDKLSFNFKLDFEDIFLSKIVQIRYAFYGIFSRK
jgi:hypothetical protein